MYLPSEAMPISPVWALLNCPTYSGRASGLMPVCGSRSVGRVHACCMGMLQRRFTWRLRTTWVLMVAGAMGASSVMRSTLAASLWFDCTLSAYTEATV